MPSLDEFVKMKMVCVDNRENDVINDASFKKFEHLDLINVGSDVRDNSESLVDALHGSDLVFIVANSDSITDVSTITMIAECCRDVGALTIGVITKPQAFNLFEWGKKSGLDIENLTQKVDTILAIPDEQLFSLVKSIYGLVSMPGVVNLDFADLRLILRDSGHALMGSAASSGENAIENACRAVLDSQPFKANFSKARRVLLNIAISNNNLEITEIFSAVGIVQEALHEDANMVFGATLDETMIESVGVTVIATDFDD